MINIDTIGADSKKDMDIPLMGLLIRLVKSPLIIFDIQMKIIAFNNQAIEFFSYTAEELESLTFKNLVSKRQLDAINSFINEPYKGGIEIEEAEFILQSQKSIVAKLIINSLNHKSSTYLLAQITYDAHLSAIKDKLQKENERYFCFEQSCDEITWETDETMTLVYCSKKISSLLGFSPEDIEGKNLFELLEYEENDLNKEKLKNIIKARKRINNLEFITFTNQSEMIPIVIIASPFFDNNGVFAGYRGIVKDISSEYFLNLEMKSLKHELELRVNERTSQLEQALEKIRIENEKSKNAQLELIRMNQEIENSRTEIIKESRKLAELNERLVTSEQNLLEANAAKDKFFSIIAHDLKNPLQAMILSSYLLVQNFKIMSEDKLEFQINTIYNATNHLHNLLENLLQWARSQTGKMDFSPENINLIYLVKETIELVKPAAVDKGIKISYDVDDSTIIFVDSFMINTVIRNLLVNAVKFTRPNGFIKLSSKVIDKMVQIQVEDNGIGMTPDIVHRLFRIDYHHTTKGTNNEKGTGLGLVLCKEFVCKNGGIISVETNIGEGSTFRFTVPLGYLDDNC